MANVNLVMFAGYDATGNDGLWLSNGTDAGTHELTGIAGASTTAFDPFNFAQFGSQVLFEGTDASGKLGLWLTNGTAAGTTEITTVGAPDTSLKHSVTTPAVLNGEALFNAKDASDNYGLWVTNGTTAGTYELTGIAGASAAGVDPRWMTAYNGEVIFDGVDASGNLSLWVSNGTAAGTTELTGIRGIWTGGQIPGAGGNASGFEPHYFTVFNNEVLFDAVDASGNDGLWITNGTAAGTTELTVSGAYTGGSSKKLWGLNASDFAVLGNEVMFGGCDTSGNWGLWVTNGTATGTVELTGIAGAASQAQGGLDPSGLVSINGEVLFRGQDSSGYYGLWVTNGTAAGTQKLTGVYPENFVAFGNKVGFTAADQNGREGLWVTDGTVAGTYELSPPAGAAPAINLSGNYSGNQSAVVNGEVLFAAGYNSTGNGGGLWVTNGTASGTTQLGVAGANAAGLNANDLTVFNGKVLFNGRDLSGQSGLWVSNGTSAGTQEITSIAGANAGGINPSGMTVFNGEVLFGGMDSTGSWGLWATNGTASGTGEISQGVGYISDSVAYKNEMLFSANGGLWVTNGAAAGTQELTGIAGANINGLNPYGLTDVNGVVAFVGADSSGNNGLWVTNGAAAGTYELTGLTGASTIQNADGTLGIAPTGGASLGNVALFGGHDFERRHRLVGDKWRRRRHLRADRHRRGIHGSE